MKTFLKYDKPLLCAMIQCETPDECIEKIKLSIDEGADALGIQLCKLRREYRTPAELKRIFEACGDKPTYVTSYRYGFSADFTDDECVELLLMALDCGATLCDVMGDLFGRSPELELTEDEEAIAKQKALIDEIHRRGGEVLMSSHTFKSTTLEENLKIASGQAARGADIIKIVNDAKTADEIPKYIECIQKILAKTDKKLLFLVGGKGEIIRYIGPNLGVCMYLCVAYQGPHDTREQPLISRAKAVRDNIVLYSDQW